MKGGRQARLAAAALRNEIDRRPSNRQASRVKKANSLFLVPLAVQELGSCLRNGPAAKPVRTKRRCP